MKYKTKRKEENRKRKGTKKIKDEREREKRRRKRKKNENRFWFPFSFPSFSFSFDFNAHSEFFSSARIRGRVFSPLFFFFFFFFTSFVPFLLFERAAFCACTMTINIITFAVSRNLYRSPGEILLCSIIEGRKGRKSQLRACRNKNCRRSVFHSRETSAAKRFTRCAQAFVPVFIRFLTRRQFSLREPRDELSQVSTLNGWMIAF